MAKPNKKNKQSKFSFFDKLDRFFKNYQGKIFIISLLLTVLFSFLLFNFNVNLMGDDAAYVKRAYRLLHYGDFPSFQGPLYPFVLSLIMWIFGLNFTLLKVLSGLFILGHLYFFYKAFKDKIPTFIHIITIVLLSTNAYLLNYSSWTFSEALFLFIQALLFYYLLKYVWESDLSSYKERIIKFLLLGLILLLLAKTRSVGYGAIITVMLFFGITRKWKYIFYTLVSFSLFYFVF